jgi:hypothetical protein
VGSPSRGRSRLHSRHRANPLGHLSTVVGPAANRRRVAIWRPFITGVNTLVTWSFTHGICLEWLGHCSARLGATSRAARAPARPDLQ